MPVGCQSQASVLPGSHMLCFVRFATAAAVVEPALCLLIVSRLEEKESDMKNEYTKLHERHTEVCLLDWSLSKVYLMALR